MLPLLSNLEPEHHPRIAEAARALLRADAGFEAKVA
jgi:hypothetical protein